VYKNRPLRIEQVVRDRPVRVCIESIDRSSGYCREMICTDFLTDPHIDEGNPVIRQLNLPLLGVLARRATADLLRRPSLNSPGPSGGSANPSLFRSVVVIRRDCGQNFVKPAAPISSQIALDGSGCADEFQLPGNGDGQRTIASQKRHSFREHAPPYQP